VGHVSSKNAGVFLVAVCAIVVLALAQARLRPSAPAAPSSAVYGYEVINSFPHDREAFTQGLIFRDGFLFESTGGLGRSSLRKIRLETGEVLQRRVVERQYFAEGLTDWNGRLLQLTWTSNVGFVYDLTSFNLTSTFGYRGEGWGLTHDSTRLIMSDGTPTLRFLDPATFKETGRVTVRDGGDAVDELNELEVVKGSIFANVWHSDRIAMIAPESGMVTGWIDLAGLMRGRQPNGEDVLNGIAYDAQRDRLFVTGKLWPRLFEIRIR
jgi:glutaminyl-peptide cyclotransferase